MSCEKSLLFVETLKLACAFDLPALGVMAETAVWSLELPTSLALTYLELCGVPAGLGRLMLADEMAAVADGDKAVKKLLGRVLDNFPSRVAQQMWVKLV